MKHEKNIVICLDQMLITFNYKRLLNASKIEWVLKKQQWLLEITDLQNTNRTISEDNFLFKKNNGNYTLPTSLQNWKYICWLFRTHKTMSSKICFESWRENYIWMIWTIMWRRNLSNGLINALIFFSQYEPKEKSASCVVLPMN